MKLFHNLSAYYNGRVKYSGVDKIFIPPYVFNYSRREKYWFVSGILNSAQYYHPEFVIYSHSTIYLVELQSIFKQLDIDSSIVANNVEKYIKIDFSAIVPHLPYLHINCKRCL